MIIKTTVCEPIRKKDGSWDLIEYEREDEYPESEVRHCDLCTACGFSAYPECREWCPNEEIEKKKKS